MVMYRPEWNLYRDYFCDADMNIAIAFPEPCCIPNSKKLYKYSVLSSRPHLPSSRLAGTMRNFTGSTFHTILIQIINVCSGPSRTKAVYA